MDIGSIETSDPGQKPVLRTLGQFVRLGDGEARVSRDVGFGPKLVPNPADAQLPDLLDAFHGDKGLGGLIDERGINGIHQPRTYLRDRQSQHTENRHVMSMPTSGSANCHPMATPPAPSSTARL
jgi:hypothetical protein